MRRLSNLPAFAAIAIICAGIAPALAQPTFTAEETAAATASVKAAALPGEFDKLMWCSAAFGVLGPYLKQNGQGDAAAEIEQLHRTTTTRAAEAANAAGMAQSAYEALAEAYTIYTVSQITTKGDYSQDECTAAGQ